jgi:undecaprenyl diphosphate synthase
MVKKMIVDRVKLPRHIAIIMDGNGRWAKKRGLLRVMGHRAGIKTVREIVTACAEMHIEILTLYAFSAENWKRPADEVGTLMKFLDEYLRKELPELMENNIRFGVIGRTEMLPDFVQKRLAQVVEATSRNTGLRLVLALNYGGRAEVVDAAKKIASDVASGRCDVELIDEELFSNYLYTKGLPDPDLVIRTSGEMRLSNFLLWQSSYSEIYVTPKLWPDFTAADLKAAIEEFQKRERRFGGVD